MLIAGLFMLHRDTALMAISKYHEDPLNSMFGPSVMATFNAAKAIIGTIHSCAISARHPVDRIWYLLDLTVTAAVCAMRPLAARAVLTKDAEHPCSVCDPVSGTRLRTGRH
jgi:hypothetical protein